MDGTYGNVFPANNNPLNTGAPNSNNKYQINVNRSKTKKWANFKPQNYDGDDWGSEEYDDVDEEPLAAPRQPVKQYKPYTPALSLQTQQPPAAPSGRIAQMVAASSSPATPNAVERTGPFGQPQYDAPWTNSPVVGGKQVLPSMMRVATMPQNGGPASTQFPPRKSSMGPREIPDMTGPNRQPRSTTWAVPTQTPWPDARSASPNARSPVSPHNNKPLPLPRPADVYRRMGENSTNPGLQSSGPAIQEQPDTGAHPTGLNLGQNSQERRGSAAGNEGGENSWGRRPSLAPVAERNSEYGTEGLLTGPASNNSGIEPVAFGEEEDKIRRFSTSPKLPDLTRLSGFGEDLFSTRFSVLAPQLASIPDVSNPSSPAKGPEPEGISAQNHVDKDAEPENAIVTPANPNVAPTSVPVTEPVPTTQAPAPSIGGAAVSDATPQFAQNAIRSESPPNELAGLQYNRDDANESHSVADAPQESQSTMATPPETLSSDMDKHLARPRLPGGWVTETLSIPGETPPPARDDSFASVTSSFPQPPSAPVVLKPKADAEGATSDDQSQQHNLLGSSKSSEAATESSNSTSNGEAAQATPTSEKDMQTGLAPTMEPSKQRDITPTAPLSFNRGLLGSKPAEPLRVLPSPTLGGGSTSNTPGDSPLKESDLLRDEITKFLGNPEISGSFLDVTQSSTTSSLPVVSATRESSYFGDVYGDYFAASEDNGPGNPGATTQPNATDTPTPMAAGTPKGIVVAPLSVANSTSSGSAAAISAPKQDATGETSGAPELRRRFSWEGPSEQDAANTREVDSSTKVEQESRRSGPDGVSFASPSSPAEDIGERMALTLSIPDEHISTTTETAVEPAPTTSGGLPHDVSELSTLPSRSMLQPASPISASSDDDAESRSRALSMGQDKILVQPSEQHPAFKEKPLSRRSSSGPKDPVNIISFRQIMDMPSSADRLKHYNETRLQFAAIDTGLEEWLVAMRSTYPEHANATSSYKESLTMPVTPMDRQQNGEMSALSPGYFQQGGRPGTHMPMPPSLPHGHSGFAHSSQQVGTKGKELLFAAGKAGKGLLSKGKSKLRGTGDKVFF